MAVNYTTNDFSLAKSNENDSTPSTGLFTAGQIVLNNSGSRGTMMGWKCVVAGQGEDTPWAANTTVPPYATVYANGKVYGAGAAGGTTGTAAPSHAAGNILDGTVTWTYLNIHAQFDLLDPDATPAQRGKVLQAAAQANSTAIDVATLVADFNALLAKLRAAGLLATS